MADNHLEFIASHIDELKAKYKIYSSLQDYELFTLLCMKYYFFSEDAQAFDVELVLNYFTDGKNNGGIDAIFNDLNSENNDVIIMQCKYYKSTLLTADDIKESVLKIKNTLKQLKNNQFDGLNERLANAYRDAINNMGENGNIKIYFFTTYQPKDKRSVNKIEKSLRFMSEDIEINYGKDIEGQIELCDNGKSCVEYDKLKLDKAGNKLCFDESVIVNVSAQSLADLYSRRKNGLLGLNLRYYTRQKKVDSGIQKTIEEEPEMFWYKNNGIVIFCDNFVLDGIELKLYNFSIINGGQTTNRLSRLDIQKDFYLQCKVIKAPSDFSIEPGQFAYDVAEATNAQKPIKIADLKANTPEQLSLKKRLRIYNVYYITKKGDKASKAFNPHYGVSKIDKVGKISLAGVLQMPGSARSNPRKMYTDENYYSIFGNEAHAGVIADLLKVDYYYDQFKKNYLKNLGYTKEEQSVFNNAKTFQISSIGLLCKIVNHVFEYEQIDAVLHDQDSLKRLVRQTGDMERLINNTSISETEEMQLMYKIFNVIGGEVLVYCYQNVADESQNASNNPSNYFKSDAVYYRDILPRLWKRYKQNKELNLSINELCIKG